MNRLDTILSLLERHRLHPLQPGGKKPLLKEWPELEVIEKDVRLWFGQGCNFGLITDRAAVLDFDEKEPAREFFKENRRLIKTIVETRRGIHFWFRNEGSIRNTTGTPDVRGIGGYVVSPGSLVEGHEYRFIDGYAEIDPAKMEPLRAEWLPKKNRVGSTRNRITDGVKYIMHIRAVFGDGAHDAAFRAACKLRDSGLTEEESLAELVLWNETNCVAKCGNPCKFTVQQLIHKVRDAFAKGAICGQRETQ